ncbi:MAG: hypothetical protein M5U28_29640 [Sandaracinaceae bacterium]|nr:hypothetical protein [Sandaracinaceae bacterium]
MTIDGLVYEHRFTRVFPIVEGETFPIELGVVPRDGDPTRTAYFEAFALSCADPVAAAGCVVVTETGAQMAFVPGRRMRYTLWLSAACIDVECPMGERCRYYGCGPLEPDEQCLLPADEGTGAEPFVCPADLPPCGPPQVFTLTETPEPLVVPEAVRYLYVAAWGAGGNDERQCGETPDGGPGGFTEAVFAVTPGTELTAIVGKRGRSGTSGEDIVRFGFGAWGGGGLTGLFRGSGPLTENDRDRALVIAGGGGSASAPGCSAGIPGNYPGAGGQPTMMGEAPPAGSPVGGGGGYEGGRAGGTSIPSAGGTGYVAPEAIDSRLLYSEPGTNRPPRDDHPDYVPGVGVSEGSGHLVIRFACEEPLL